MILRCSGIFFASYSLILLHPSVFCHQDCCHNFRFPPQAEAPIVTSSILCVAQTELTPAQLLEQESAPSGHSASSTVVAGLENSEILLCPVFRSGNRADSPKSGTVPLQSAF